MISCIHISPVAKHPFVTFHRPGKKIHWYDISPARVKRLTGKLEAMGLVLTESCRGIWWIRED